MYIYERTLLLNIIFSQNSMLYYGYAIGDIQTVGTLQYRLSGFSNKDIGIREIMCPSGLAFSI